MLQKFVPHRSVSCRRPLGSMERTGTTGKNLNYRKARPRTTESSSGRARARLTRDRSCSVVPVFGRTGRAWAKKLRPSPSLICRALTGHVESPEKANGIVCPCRNWSVFDFGRCRRTPSVVNCTDSLVMCVVCLFASQDSHVNSDGRRNAANVTQKAVLRFSSS